MMVKFKYKIKLAVKVMNLSQVQEYKEYKNYTSNDKSVV